MGEICVLSAMYFAKEPQQILEYHDTYKQINTPLPGNNMSKEKGKGNEESAEEKHTIFARFLKCVKMFKNRRKQNAKLPSKAKKIRNGNAVLLRAQDQQIPCNK